MRTTLSNVRIILKDPFYQKEFKGMLHEEIKNLPIDSQIKIINEFKRSINEKTSI